MNEMKKEMKGAHFVGFFIREEQKIYLASVNHAKTYQRLNGESDLATQLGFMDQVGKLKLENEFVSDLQKDIWRIALNPHKSKAKNQAPKGEGIPIQVGDIIKVG